MPAIAPPDSEVEGEAAAEVEADAAFELADEEEEVMLEGPEVD
jgi:hypothetical protein